MDYREADEIKHGISDVLRDALDPDGKGVIVTKWVIIVESIDSHGQRGLTPIVAPDMLMHDVIGMTGAIDAEMKHLFSTTPYSEMNGDG